MISKQATLLRMKDTHLNGAATVSIVRVWAAQKIQVRVSDTQNFGLPCDF